MTQRAVLFDLGNTLVGYYDLAEFPPILEQCLRRAGEALAASNDVAAFGALYERALHLNRERSDHAVQPLAERLESLFGVRLPASRRDAVCAAFMQPIFARAQLDAQALPLLRALRSRGVRVGLVSNTPWGSSGPSWRAELDRHGLRALLDACVFCVDVGLRKPHVAPFRRALALLGVTAEHTLFVGDDPIWDVAGARAAGLTPLLLDPRGESASEEYATIASLEQLLTLIDSPRAGRAQPERAYP